MKMDGIERPARWRGRVAAIAAWFGVASVLVLLRFGYVYLDDLARRHEGTFLPRLIEEATGGYTAAILFVLVVLFTLRFRLQRRDWARTLPVYLLVMLGFSIAHTTLMAITRKIIFPLAGLGDYNYGIMSYRYLMEFSNQVVFFWIAVVLTHLIAHYRESRDRELRTAQLETELAQAQLHALQSQIQPHFLFNALNTISAVLYEDAPLADAMIARLSHFLRSLLSASPAQEVTLREEFELLNLYLNIMRPRFGDRLQVDFSVEPEIDDALLPRLILQPLVENSIKHAADPVSGFVRIEVSALRQNGSLLLQVKDNGTGVPAKEPPVPGNGFGLANTIARLRHLYGDRQEFSMKNGDGGFLIQIKLPFQHASNSE